MPIYLPPIGRRRFLAGVAGIFSGGVCPRLAFGAEADPDSLALMADTHVSANRAETYNHVNMADNLAAVVKQITAWPNRPAAGLVVGDLARKDGQNRDYIALYDLLTPLREAGLPIHLTLGNHDERQRFGEAMASRRLNPGRRRLPEKLTEVVPRAHANLFLLDTLEETDAVPGRCGEAQLAWLARELDARPDKPAIVFGHHDPMFEPPPAGKKPGGLLDTAELFRVLNPRKQAKAYVYGHTHDWGVKQRAGIHLINLPPTSYVFQAGRPSGWVHATLRPDGARLELRCMDEQHRDHGQVVDLKWRT
jgi:3',5'-cyclic AMP phosphodiesterase CpdA